VSSSTWADAALEIADDLARSDQASTQRDRLRVETRKWLAGKWNQDAYGDKQAAILQAEGKLEASKREAEAQVILAQASQRSIQLVTEAVGEKEMPVVYLLGEKYINAIEELAGSENCKSLVFPADIPAAVRGLMGKT